jgi:hypothetical protein
VDCGVKPVKPGNDAKFYDTVVIDHLPMATLSRAAITGPLARRPQTIRRSQRRIISRQNDKMFGSIYRFRYMNRFAMRNFVRIALTPRFESRSGTQETERAKQIAPH